MYRSATSQQYNNTSEQIQLHLGQAWTLCTQITWGFTSRSSKHVVSVKNPPDVSHHSCMCTHVSDIPTAHFQHGPWLLLQQGSMSSSILHRICYSILYMATLLCWRRHWWRYILQMKHGQIPTKACAPGLSCWQQLILWATVHIQVNLQKQWKHDITQNFTRDAVHAQ